MPPPPPPHCPLAHREATSSRTEKGGEARRTRAEVMKGELEAGFSWARRCFRQGTRDDALPPSSSRARAPSRLQGVGQGAARGSMEELDISESRRLRGLGRTSARGLLCNPKTPRSA